MSLDDRLKAVRFKVKMFAGGKLGEAVETSVYLTDEAITQIKQAFVDEGYRKKIWLVLDDGRVEEVEIYKDEFVPTKGVKK